MTIVLMIDLQMIIGAIFLSVSFWIGYRRGLTVKISDEIDFFRSEIERQLNENKDSNHFKIKITDK